MTGRNSGGGPSSPFYNPSQPRGPAVRPVTVDPHSRPSPQPRVPLPDYAPTQPQRPAQPAMPSRAPDPARPIRP